MAVAVIVPLETEKTLNQAPSVAKVVTATVLDITLRQYFDQSLFELEEGQPKSL